MASKTSSPAFRGPGLLAAASIFILGAGRIIFGIASLVAPIYIFQQCALDIGSPDGVGVFLARLFGNREIVVGGGLLYALFFSAQAGRGEGGLLRNWVLVNLVMDVSDALVCLAAGMAGCSVVKGGAVQIGGAAAGMVGLGVVALLGV